MCVCYCEGERSWMLSLGTVETAFGHSLGEGVDRSLITRLEGPYCCEGTYRCGLSKAVGDPVVVVVRYHAGVGLIEPVYIQVSGAV